MIDKGTNFVFVGRNRDRQRLVRDHRELSVATRYVSNEVARIIDVRLWPECLEVAIHFGFDTTG